MKPSDVLKTMQYKPTYQNLSYQLQRTALGMVINLMMTLLQEREADNTYRLIKGKDNVDRGI